jgi:hypothetical protein
MLGSRQKAYLIIFATFALGFIVGGAATSILLGRSATRPAAPPRIIDELSTELKLDPAQREAVDRILAEARGRFQELRRELNPRFDQIRNQNNERIRAILTPDQQALFDQWQQREDLKREQRRRNSPKPGP